MSTLNVPVLVTVILLVPMFYFGIASLTFFLRPFDDPIVTWMLRGLFSTYFLMVTLGCGLGAVVFAAYGRPIVAIGLAGVAGCAVVSRRGFLQRMDAQFHARDHGDGAAIRRLHRLHVCGIAYNAFQIVGVIGFIQLAYFAAQA